MWYFDVIDYVIRNVKLQKYPLTKTESVTAWMTQISSVYFNRGFVELQGSASDSQGFPAIAQKALQLSVQFSTSYLCEFRFSATTTIMHKKRERLLFVEEKLRVCLSKIRPRIQALCRNRQAHHHHHYRIRLFEVVKRNRQHTVQKMHIQYMDTSFALNFWL